MNILIIKKNNEKHAYLDRIIEDGFTKICNRVEFIEYVDNVDEAYLLHITSLIKETEIGVVFSTEYLEQYSLICGVLGIIYASWIFESEDSSSFSFTIRNEWNMIFTSNSYIYSFLSKNGCKRLYFLPLSYQPDKIDISDIYEEDTTEDIIFWTEGISNSMHINNILNDLKDASKGYIDATLAVRQADISNLPFASNLPAYVLNDIYFNVEYEQKNMLTKPEYIDRSIFFPLLDRNIAFVYLSMLIGVQVVDKLTFALYRENPYENDKIVKLDRSEIIEGKYALLGQYKIAIYFGEFKYYGMVSQEIINIMAMGIFVLCSANTDLAFLGEDAPETFKNTWELETKVRFYLHNEEERNKKALQTRKKVLELGSYDDRVKKILKEIESAVQ